MKQLIKNKTYLPYIILAGVSCVSFLFSNLSYDAEYQLAMAYRLLKGDTLILQMWEPHQTSAFLCAIIMKLWLLLTGSTTGIVLFTQGIGLLIRTGIALYVYKTIRRVTNTPAGTIAPHALIAGMMYLLISPKDLLVPEFSNMQIWFATLTCLLLVNYFQDKKLWQLIFSAVCLCLGVFSYPSFVIAYLAVFFLLLKYSTAGKRDITLFTCICALIGGTFVAYLLISVGLDTILMCLPKALALEPTHTISMSARILTQLLEIAKLLGLLAAICLSGLLIEKILSGLLGRKTQSGKGFSADRWLMISWYLLMVILFANIISVENTGAHIYPQLAILLLGFSKRKLCTDAEKILYHSALWIGITNLLATILLSDLGFLRSIPYMHVATCVSAVPIFRWFEECTRKAEAPSVKKLFTCGVHVFLLLVVFRCIYIHCPIHGASQICSLSSDLSLIRSGPAFGIITDEGGAAKQRDSFNEWQQYIRPGDTIYLLGEPLDTLGYLYQDVEVGAPSVISTPAYHPELLSYWEINPDKYPDVIILASTYGELTPQVANVTWLMEWLEEEYRAETVIDGNYWRYYFKTAR